MQKFFFSNPLSAPQRLEARPVPYGVSMLMRLMFLVGILSGGLVGLYTPLARPATDVENYVFLELLPSSFGRAFWNSGRFFLLLFAASTSWLGVFLAPAVVLLRGYLLSCSVSALFSAYAYQGLLFSFLLSGVPALFLAPALLIAASDVFASSRTLFFLRFGRNAVPDGKRLIQRFFLIALLILCDAFYSFYLLPEILVRI